MNTITLWNTSVISNNDSRPISTFIKHDKATTHQARSCYVIPHCLVHRCQYFGKPAASTVTLHASTMLMETAHSPEITYLPTTCHIPEDNNLHCHFCENVKSHMGLPIWSHKQNDQQPVLLEIKVRSDSKKMVAYFYVKRVHVTQLTVRPGSNCWNKHVPVTSSSNILHCVCVWICMTTLVIMFKAQQIYKQMHLHIGKEYFPTPWPCPRWQLDLTAQWMSWSTGQSDSEAPGNAAQAYVAARWQVFTYNEHYSDFMQTTPV